MSIPTFRDFIHPLLQHLASHAEGVRTVDAYEAVADAALAATHVGRTLCWLKPSRPA